MPVRGKAVACVRLRWRAKPCADAPWRGPGRGAPTAPNAPTPCAVPSWPAWTPTPSTVPSPPGSDDPATDHPVGSHQAGIVDADRDLDPVGQLHLDEDVGDVGLDRGQAHVQLTGDLGVGLALPDRDGDLSFPSAPAGHPCRRAA